MSEIMYRWMRQEETTKIAEIDRSEEIRIGYENIEGSLRKLEVNWDSPAWFAEGDDNYSVNAQIRFCQGHLSRQGRMYGAFHHDKLIGIGIVQTELREATAQLAFLHVSNLYRQQKIGARIFKVLLHEAKRAGARHIYVSATPSGSAIGFYFNLGFKLVEEPIPELFELEPDDIHMMRPV